MKIHKFLYMHEDTQTYILYTYYSTTLGTQKLKLLDCEFNNVHIKLNFISFLTFNLCGELEKEKHNTYKLTNNISPDCR